MSDVADILGNEKPQLSASDEAARLFADKSKPRPKAAKPKGMSRELFSLVGAESLAPAVQTDTIVFKNRRQSAQGKWIWAKFANSARSDNKTFYHWVKADLQHAEYPYAKFNTRLDTIAYTDDEYEKFLSTPQWTRSETDHLMYICAEYDLRWPVIVDRYTPTPPRTTEELMARYYFVSSKIKAVRAGMTDYNVKNSNTSVFDFDYERLRRVQQEALYRRTPEEDAEETRLKEELKNVDAALKRLKKLNKLPKPATNASKSTPPPIVVTFNTPAAGTPCLQSGRLVAADRVHTGLAKSTVKKVTLMMKELGVPDKLLPTNDICDAYENIQRDLVALFSLQNAIAKKEKDLQSVKQSLGVSKRSQVVVPHAKLLVKEVEVPYVEKVPVVEAPATSNAAQSTVQSLPANTTTKKSSSHKRKSSEMKASAPLTAGIASIQPATSSSTTAPAAATNKPPAKRKK